jgi:hypothetical protein
MMIEKVNEQVNENPTRAVGRSPRKKYETRGYKRCGVTRTDETRQWYEIPDERSRRMEIRKTEPLT